jgi:hypothetical protein
MGEDGVRGPTGLIGPTGPSGTPGISEPNIRLHRWLARDVGSPRERRSVG